MLKDFTKEKFDVLIQAGQSNSEGYGFGPVDEPYRENDRVWYLNGDFTLTPAAEKVNGNEIQSNFSLAFAEEYVKNGFLAEDRKLLIVRSAVGGTGFLDNQWKPEDPLFLRMMEMTRCAMALNPENRLRALLWHQGETDAGLHASYDVHYAHLSTLLRLVREAFDAPALPFVAGDFVQHWKGDNMEVCIPVVDAIRAVCRDCGSGAFVETDGLLSNMQELRRNPLGWEDPIHFSRKSIYILGRRYFEAWREIAKEER